MDAYVAAIDRAERTRYGMLLKMIATGAQGRAQDVKRFAAGLGEAR